MDNIIFNGIYGENNEMMVGEFSKEEIKDVIWNCDSLKSNGSD